jgi:hypothetical protein
VFLVLSLFLEIGPPTSEKYGVYHGSVYSHLYLDTATVAACARNFGRLGIISSSGVQRRHNACHSGHFLSPAGVGAGEKH